MQPYLLHDRHDGQILLYLPQHSLAICLTKPDGCNSNLPTLQPGCGFPMTATTESNLCYERIPPDGCVVQFDFYGPYPALYHNSVNGGIALALSRFEGVYLVPAISRPYSKRPFGFYMSDNSAADGECDFECTSSWSRYTVPVSLKIGGCEAELVASGALEPTCCKTPKTKMNVEATLDAVKMEFVEQLLAVQHREEAAQKRSFELEQKNSLQSGVIRLAQKEARMLEEEISKLKWCLEEKQYANELLRNERDEARSEIQWLNAKATTCTDECRTPRHLAALKCVGSYHRLLCPDEYLQQGDEIFSNYSESSWLPTHIFVGQSARDLGAIFRRRIHPEPFIADEDKRHNPQPGAGHRILGAGEKINGDIDELLTYNGSWSRFSLQPNKDACVGDAQNDSYTIRRKL